MTRRGKRPAGWSGAVHEYLTAMRAANRSPGTIRLHRHYLNQLIDLSRSPWLVREEQMLELLASGRWGPEAMRSARSVYRGFFRWAHGKGYLDHDPAFGLPTVTVPQGVARPAPEMVVRGAVEGVDARLRLMCQLAAFGGLRVREIALVRSRDLVGDELLVHGKGGKQRVVPIEEPALMTGLLLVHGWAFPNRWTGKPITAGHVSRIMSAALPGGWTAHTLRHRYASRSYDGTRDLLAVMELLGHSRPETTQRYVRITDERRRAAARATRLAA